MFAFLYTVYLIYICKIIFKLSNTNIMPFYRLSTLLQELSSEGGKTIIFAETKRKVDAITRSVQRFG